MLEFSNWGYWFSPGKRAHHLITDRSNPAVEKGRVLSCFLFRHNEQLIIKDYLDTLVALKSVGDVIQEWLLFTGWALPLLTRK